MEDFRCWRCATAQSLLHFLFGTLQGCRPVHFLHLMQSGNCNVCSSFVLSCRKMYEHFLENMMSWHLSIYCCNVSNNLSDTNTWAQKANVLSEVETKVIHHSDRRWWSNETKSQRSSQGICTSWTEVRGCWTTPTHTRDPITWGTKPHAWTNTRNVKPPERLNEQI